MPLLRISMSQKISETDQLELLKQGSSIVSEALGKSEQYVMTLFNAPVPITFGGSNDPAAFIEVKSIGHLSGENCNALCEKLSSLLQTQTGVHPDRVYLDFEDVPRNFWGWNGRTFG